LESGSLNCIKIFYDIPLDRLRNTIKALFPFSYVSVLYFNSLFFSFFLSPFHFSTTYLSSSVYIFLNNCLRPHFLSQTQFCRLIATLNHDMLHILYAFCLHIKYSAHPCIQRITTSVLVMSYSDIKFGALPVAFLAYCVLSNELCPLTLKMQYIRIFIFILATSGDFLRLLTHASTAPFYITQM